MNNTIPTFDATVGILVKAFLEGTLRKGTCHACAVGNICAAAAGTRVVHAHWENDRPVWNQVFATVGLQRFWPHLYRGESKRQIDATGYSWQQLAEIELAFETAAGGFGDEAMFAGLMAVVEILAKIHRVDLTTATAAKALFVRA